MNKFWPSNQQFHLGNPNMAIHTREFGDITGCVEAPRDSIYRPMSRELVHREFDLRAQGYANDVALYINSQLPKEEIFRRFDAPVYGAYGEKL